MRIVLNSHLEVVELVFSRLWLLECSSEFVQSLSQGQEVELVVFVRFTSNIECLSSTDEQALAVVSIDLPFSIESGCLLVSVLNLHDKVTLFLGIDGLSNGTFTLWFSCHSFQLV